MGWRGQSLFEIKNRDCFAIACNDNLPHCHCEPAEGGLASMGNAFWESSSFFKCVYGCVGKYREPTAYILFLRSNWSLKSFWNYSNTLSGQKYPMSLNPRNSIYDNPNSPHNELAQYHPQKEGAGSRKCLHTSRFQNEELYEPANHYRKPKLNHRPRRSHCIAKGMKRPPSEAKPHLGEENRYCQAHTQECSRPPVGMNGILQCGSKELEGLLGRRN